MLKLPFLRQPVYHRWHSGCRAQHCSRDRCNVPPETHRTSLQCYESLLHVFNAASNGYHLRYRSKDIITKMYFSTEYHRTVQHQLTVKKIKSLVFGVIKGKNETGRPYRERVDGTVNRWRLDEQSWAIQLHTNKCWAHNNKLTMQAFLQCSEVWHLLS